MDFNPVIFDISSDEEPAFDELRGGDDDHEWLTGLLETVDRETTADAEADDVVVVGEYVQPKSKSKSRPVKVVKDVEDDDCVVLDGDPDKAADVADGAGDDGDEVMVVGETGQVACRDYPHSRHLCAKFPFSSTPHEQHCNLCHCYVCDSLAPCPHWGTGISTIDHCHATDKQETWKFQRRESFRLKNGPPLPVTRFPEPRLPITTPQLNQVPPVLPNVRHNAVYRPTATNVYSSTRLTVPNIIGRQNRNYRRHAMMVGRNRVGPCSVSQQPLSISGNSGLQSRGQQLVPCNTMFKRPGVVRAGLTSNQSVHSSSNTSFSPASRYVRNIVPGNSTGWQNGLPNPVSGSFIHPSPAQPVVQPEICSVPIAHSSHDQNVFQPGNQNQNQNQYQNLVDSSLSDFEFWINNMDQSMQLASVENTHPQTIPANNEPPVADNHFTSSQVGGSAENPKDNNTNTDLESWLLNESEGLGSESCGPVDLNIFSPAYDAGMLCFDFDTSWNGLAQV